jgi:predicted AlkP superfamily pyrophosphatase or phosphodiesterase
MSATPLDAPQEPNTLHLIAFRRGRASFLAISFAATAAILSLAAVSTVAQTPAPKPQSKPATESPAASAKRPKLVVMLVVDQMRGDYIEKFRANWTGGLKRLVDEGAWFPDAAYPYAATETCVGHSTISTGAFPASHGMISNEWWDREQQKDVTCTSDPNVKSVRYGGDTTDGGDSVNKMLIPAFADELKFQSIKPTRVVTFSLKARAAITMGGHQGDAVTWLDSSKGLWMTSSAYPAAPFVEEYAKAHPISADFGKTWAPLLPESAYAYDRTAIGSITPYGAAVPFPHPLRGAGADGNSKPDSTFYGQWSASPYSQAYLAALAADAVDKLHLGRGAGTDYLGVSFSSLDYVAHAFGPRSWEVQDELAHLDRDLGTLFAHLDKSVGRGNYVVAFSADHGGAPIPEDLKKTGVDSGWLSLEEVRNRAEKALESFEIPKPAIASVGGSDLYLKPGVLDKLQSLPQAYDALLKAIESVPGVAKVYLANEVDGRPATLNPILRAESASFYRPRSGDLIIVPKPYWPWDYGTAKSPRRYGTTHGTPYYYDQRVPVIFMGYGIQPGQYHADATPADIAPTLAEICGITLVSRDGHVLPDALAKPAARAAAAPRTTPAP